MEVRLVEMLVSLLRPGQLRRRMRHASLGVGALLLVWVRAVLVSERARVSRSEMRAMRDQRIRHSLEERNARMATAIAQQQLLQDVAEPRGV